MKAAVYQSLRDEMTAWFTAMHNFEIAQYGVVAVVFGVLLTGTEITLLAIKAIAVIVFIFLMSKVYTDVQNKATRVGSYILVAYELQARDKAHEPDEEFQYWILANRSSSARGIEERKRDYFGFNKEFSRFYGRQTAIIIFFWLLSSLMILRAYFAASRQASILDMISVGFFLAFTFVCFVSIRKDNEASKTYGKEQVKNWKAYWDAKTEFDDRFLLEAYDIHKNQSGINRAAQGGVHPASGTRGAKKAT